MAEAQKTVEGCHCRIAATCFALRACFKLSANDGGDDYSVLIAKHIGNVSVAVKKGYDSVCV